jgi:mono/diheme cytochrome c family protein
MNRLTLAVSTLVALVASAAAPGKNDARQIARGKYLVTIGGCNDCHTPLKKTPDGPAWDMDRMLSGHPDTLSMTAAPVQDEPWGLAFGSTMTAFSGPWGTSFSRYLTPDP